MIIVDEALRRREADGNPVKVAMVGAGAMGRAITLQIVRATPGMKLVAIANRTPATAQQAYIEAGVDSVSVVNTRPQLTEALEAGRCAVTDDPALLCEADGIEVVLEVTGAVEFGAHVVMNAIQHGKHVVTMNAELQGTLGPILKTYADRAGMVLTDSDGDQPGVIMNLYRFVRGLGVRAVLAGNIKGLQDAYRTPTTQADFARRGGLSPQMATSFADGTKMSFEMALVANATGMRVRTGGMLGPTCADVHDAAGYFSMDELLEGRGLIDYVVGAQPAPGVFVLGYEEHPLQRHWLRMYKQGDGPLYTFYTPYHLCHLEVPTTVARAVLFHDAAVTPDFGHVVDVVATAKRDLRAGEILDGIGYYLTYGQAANAEHVQRNRLLPMGLSEGCKLIRNVPKDQILRYEDVEVPPGRLCDALRKEQETRFPMQ